MTGLPFAIIGTGRIAADYLTALAGCPALRLAGVADLRAEVARAVGERWSCPAFRDVQELLGASDARAVLVAVPPSEHERVALTCLEHGVHVLCEKPFALRSDAARRMLGVAAEAGLVLTMSAKFRHVPDVIEAKARVESGALGDVIAASNVFASEVAMRGRWNAAPQISGGGVLIDNGTHSVDLLRYLLGPVAWIAAHEGRRVQELPVEDTVDMSVGFRSGVLANARLSWSITTYGPWYLGLHGTAATLRLGWKSSTIARPGAPEGRPFGSGYDKVEALGRQLAHFARTIEGAEPCLLDAGDILASVATIEAAYESLEAGGARVLIDEPDPGP